MKYTVTIDALGFEGGVGRRGETVTEEQVGTDNVQRLVMSGFIVAQADGTEEAPSAPTEPTEPAGDEEQAPSKIADDLSVGIKPADDYELSDEDETFLDAIADGTAIFEFSTEKVNGLSKAVLQARCEAFGAGTDGTKAELVERLQEAATQFVKALADNAPTEPVEETGFTV